MTAMMSPPAAALHFMPNSHSAPAPPTVSAPRSGILLNASPCSSAPNSPKRTPYLLSPFPSGAGHTSLSSHSSASSSTSSTDDFASSTSATSAGGSSALNPSTSHNHHQQQPGSRKIRFAPLPEPRRDGYDDDFALPSPFAEVDSAASSPRLSLLSTPTSPQIIPPTPTRPASNKDSSLNVSQLATGSCSTLGLSFDGSDPPDSGQATETNTIAGSECGTDETQTALPSRKKVLSWTRLLRLPKHAPRQGAGAGRSNDDYVGISSLFRASSRESTSSICSLSAFAAGDANESTSSLTSPLSRRKSTGADGAVPPVFSFRGGFSLKPVISEAGTAASPTVSSKKGSVTVNAPVQINPVAGSSSAPPTVRRGTRLLNGRVYGARGTLAANPFATARDAEPEFVEWGHGGMGSVKGARAAGNAGAWTALQSSQTLSVGHVADGERTGEDEDDGSGMGWVKRRREQREREKKEEKERERLEREKKGEIEGDVEEKESAETAQEPGSIESSAATADVAVSTVPADAGEQKEVRDDEDKVKPKVEELEVETKEKETGEGEEALAEKTEKQEPGHVYTAVTVPAPKPKVHHHHSHTYSTHSVHSMHSHVHSSTGSAAGTPIAERGAASLDFSGARPSPLGVAAVLQPSEEEEGQEITIGAGAGTLTPTSTTSTSSSSLNDSEEDGEGTNNDDADEEDGDEEDEDTEGGEENDQTRKTAIGAGVEKISRHKD